MDLLTSSVIETITAAVAITGITGIIVGWRIVVGKHKLAERELQVEELRLENQARQLDIEQQRLRLVLDDNARALYNQLPR
jgi:hypothetical protein